MRARVAELSWDGSTMGTVLAGVTGYRAAVTRVLVHNDRFFQHGIVGRRVPCPQCRRPARLRLSAYQVDGYCDVQPECAHCGTGRGIAALDGVALSSPAGRAFWRAHRRIRFLPALAVEAAGVPAVVARFQSVTGSAVLAVVLARDTLSPIAVHGAPGE
jgi:hypothetical protein